MINNSKRGNMSDNQALKKRLCYFTVLIFLIFFNSVTIIKSEGKTANAKEANSKADEGMLNKLILKIASFSPINPYLLKKSENLCTEITKGIPIQIQSKNISSVFKRDGSLQCEEKEGIPVEVMKKQLKKMGVKVFKAVKGQLGKSRGLSVCGAPTNNINIFYISSKKQKQVLNKGFHSCVKKSVSKN